MKMQDYKKIFLVHGINVSDEGADTVCKAGRYFQGNINTMVINCPYDRIGPLGAIFKNKKIATRLKKGTRVSNSDVGAFAIGHSNGCAIIIEAARQGACFESVVFINPALKASIKIPSSIRRVLVIYTEHDKATRAARFFDKVPFISLIIPDIWGAMGAVGYQGPHDDRVINADCSEDLKGHSDFFEDKNLRHLMPMIKRLAITDKGLLCSV